MYGSFIGDIVGAPYEFDVGPRNKNIRFFAHPKSRYTDDSLLTVAVGEALMDLKKVDMNHLPNGKSKADVCKDAIKKSIRKWCNDSDYAHLQDEYGLKFYKWLKGKKDTGAPSLGNGSAMRVGAAGWLYDSLEETIEMAGYTAEVSHRHPEGIKGAQAVAAAIYMARTGSSKQEIKDYITQRFGYNLNMTVADLRQNNLFIDERNMQRKIQDETCPVCVPQAIVCFLEADSYEDAVKNAISIGGDTDTIGAITGSMAEALYGVPAEMREKADAFLDDKMRAVTRRFLKERSGQKELTSEDVATDLSDPLKEIEQQGKSGNVSYKYFIDRMEELAFVSEPGSVGQKFGKFAAEAVRTGYPLSDLKDLFEVRRALDMDPGKDNADVNAARQHCEEVWNQILKNTKDGEPVPLTAEDRCRNLEAMKTALTSYKDAIGCMNPAGRYVNDVAIYGLHQRIGAGLTPSEQMRVAGSVEEGFALLDRVTPSGMRSSGEYKELRTAYKKYLSDLRNPEKQAESEESRRKLLVSCNKYLSYKFEQNKGLLHKRSAIEAHRVALIEALRYRVRNDNFNKEAPAPEDPKVRKLMNDAEKQLFLGKDKKVAAAVLLSAKKMKDNGEPLTPNTLRARSRQCVEDKAFVDTVAACHSADIGTMIRTGVFDQKMAEARKDRDFIAALPQLEASWRNERMLRRARTDQIINQKVAQMKANGTWPTEPVQKEQAKQPAKQPANQPANQAPNQPTV